MLTGPDLIVDRQRPSGWTLERDPWLLESSVPGQVLVLLLEGRSA